MRSLTLSSRTPPQSTRTMTNIHESDMETHQTQYSNNGKSEGKSEHKELTSVFSRGKKHAQDKNKTVTTHFNTPRLSVQRHRQTPILIQLLAELEDDVPQMTEVVFAFNDRHFVCSKSSVGKEKWKCFFFWARWRRGALLD